MKIPANENKFSPDGKKNFSGRNENYSEQNTDAAAAFEGHRRRGKK